MFPYAPQDCYAMFGAETTPGTPAVGGYYIGVCNMPRKRVESGLQAVRSIGDWRPILLKGGAFAGDGRIRFQPQAGEGVGKQFLQAGLRTLTGANRGQLPSLTIESGISYEFYQQTVGSKLRTINMTMTEQEALICEATWWCLDDQWLPLASEKYQDFTAVAVPDVYFWYEGYFDLGPDDISTIISQCRLDIQHVLRRPYAWGTAATTSPRGPVAIRATSQQIRGTLRTHDYLVDDLGIAALPNYASIVVRYVSEVTGGTLTVTISDGKWRWKENQEVTPERLAQFGCEFEAIDVRIT